MFIFESFSLKLFFIVIPPHCVIFPLDREVLQLYVIVLLILKIYDKFPNFTNCIITLNLSHDLFFIYMF